MGLPYNNIWEDRVRNYFIGLRELGLDTAPMTEHFKELLGAEVAGRMITQVEREFDPDAIRIDEHFIIPEITSDPGPQLSEAPTPLVVPSVPM